MGDVFPFVVGCGRSGTTMLRAMLDSHPLVAVPHESYFVTPALRRPGRIRGGGRARPVPAARRPRAGRHVHPLAARSRAVRAVRDDEGAPDRPGRARPPCTGPSRPRPASPGTPTRPPATSSTRSPRPEHAGRPVRPPGPRRPGRRAVDDGSAVLPGPVRRGRHLLERPGADRAPGRPGPRPRPVPRGPVRRARRRPRGHAPGLCDFSTSASTRRCSATTSGPTRSGRRHRGRPPPGPLATPDPGDPELAGDHVAPRPAGLRGARGPTLDEFGYERSGLPPSRSARREALAWRTRTGLARRTGGLRARVKGAWGSVSR